MIEEAVKNFEVAKKAVEDLLQKQRELIKRVDDAREKLPLLERACVLARGGCDRASDSFILGECTETEFQKYNDALEKAEKSLLDGRAVFDVLTKQTKAISRALPEKHGDVQLAERKTWEAIADEVKAAIPVKVFGLVEKWLSIKAQLGQPYEFALQSLFPRPTFGRIQQIQKQIREEHKID